MNLNWFVTVYVIDMNIWVGRGIPSGIPRSQTWPTQLKLIMSSKRSCVCDTNPLFYAVSSPMADSS